MAPYTSSLAEALAPDLLQRFDRYVRIGSARWAYPTPNIFTGGHAYHSVREWASLQDMAAAAAVIVHLTAAWAR